MKRSILILALILLPVHFSIFSQSKEQNHKDNYPYQVSFKAGYHSKDNERQNGFPDGWIADLSFRRKFGQYWSIGANAEYWQRTAEILHEGILYSENYKSYSINLQVLFTSSYKNFDFSIGGVAGKYAMHYIYTGNNSTDNYLDLGFLFTPELKIGKHFLISFEISYYRLVNTEQHASLFNFKLGPAFRF
ncbi:MAG: hypothetical protein ABSF32_05325 [Ignavibacteria bacterium]|jgi:hypothetical protein